MNHKNRKKSRTFMFLSTGCSLFRFEGFSCSLGVLYGGLGLSKLQFLIKKTEIKFPAINFFSILGHQTLEPDPGPGSGSGIRICIKSMRIRNPDYNYNQDNGTIAYGTCSVCRTLLEYGHSSSWGLTVAST
jgi:hypothetical protein